MSQGTISKPTPALCLSRGTTSKKKKGQPLVGWLVPGPELCIEVSPTISSRSQPHVLPKFPPSWRSNVPCPYYLSALPWIRLPRPMPSITVNDSQSTLYWTPTDPSIVGGLAGFLANVLFMSCHHWAPSPNQTLGRGPSNPPGRVYWVMLFLFIKVI